MVRKKALPTLMDLYQKVGEVTLRYWPLLLFEVVVGILRYGLLFVCLVIPFGLFIITNATQMLKDPKTFDWGPVVNDWSNHFMDGGWLAGFLVLVLFYVTWWCLLSAVSDAWIFGVFTRYYRNKDEFTLEGL